VVRLGGAAPASVVTVPDSMPALLSAVPDNAAGEPAARHSAPAPAAPQAPAAAVTGAIGGAVASVQPQSYDETNQTAADDPVRVEPIPGVFSSWNPSNTANDVVNNTINYIEQVGEQP
jgi:hypothetical protein